MFWLSILIELIGSTAVAQVEVEGARMEINGEAPSLVIEAPATQLDLENGRGLFSGGVHATQGDLSLSADEVEVTLAPSGAIDRAVARDTVVIRQGEYQATGRVAVIDGDTMTLTGAAELTSRNHRMRGSEMVFKVGSKTVKCTDCTLVVQKQ